MQIQINKLMLFGDDVFPASKSIILIQTTEKQSIVKFIEMLNVQCATINRLKKNKNLFVETMF